MQRGHRGSNTLTRIQDSPNHWIDVISMADGDNNGILDVSCVLQFESEAHWYMWQIGGGHLAGVGSHFTSSMPRTIIPHARDRGPSDISAISFQHLSGNQDLYAFPRQTNHIRIRVPNKTCGVNRVPGTRHDMIFEWEIDKECCQHMDPNYCA